MRESYGIRDSHSTYKAINYYKSKSCSNMDSLKMRIRQHLFRMIISGNMFY